MDIVEIENGLMQLYPDCAKNISQFPIGKGFHRLVKKLVEGLVNEVVAWFFQ